MAEKIVMIALSPTMEDGKIHTWSIKEGDDISQGQVICEVETDKSTMEYESLNEGKVLKIIVPEGGSATVGQTIAIVGKEGEDISDIIASESSSARPEATPAAESSESTATAQVPKPSATVPAAPAPSVATQKPVATNASQSATVQKAVPVNNDVIKATPLARRLAQEKGVDISLIQGTGANGRIKRADVEHFASTGQSRVVATEGSVQSGQVKQKVKKPVQHSISQYDTHIPVEGVRAVIAKKLSESKFTSPHFYVKTSMQTDALVTMRTKINSLLDEKVSLNAFIIKLVASAIRKNPVINSSWYETGQGASIVHHSSIDIALAVDLGNGLITPVVRDCQSKSVELIDSELQQLIQKVKQQSIMPEEYTNATFTISNLGSFGIEEFTAIINPPAACILAVGMSKKVPVVNDNGQIEVQSKMTCSLSSDHRVIDGSVAAVFMKDLREIIENPTLALYF